MQVFYVETFMRENASRIICSHWTNFPQQHWSERVSQLVFRPKIISIDSIINFSFKKKMTAKSASRYRMKSFLVYEMMYNARNHVKQLTICKTNANSTLIIQDFYTKTLQTQCGYSASLLKEKKKSLFGGKFVKRKMINTRLRCNITARVVKYREVSLAAEQQKAN